MKFVHKSSEQVLIVEFWQQSNAFMQSNGLIPEVQPVKDIGCSFVIGFMTKNRVGSSGSSFGILCWVGCKDDFRVDAFFIQPFSHQVGAIFGGGEENLFHCLSGF